MFQFTHPGRGATRGGSIQILVSGVSIHAPREGCDPLEMQLMQANAEFQFTHPGRGATAQDPHDYRHGKFQFTHPGRGATFHRSPGRCSCQFQFTHPGRGATGSIPFHAVRVAVSIHAPREGCDKVEAICSEFMRWFQFTHPGRGATCTVSCA